MRKTFLMACFLFSSLLGSTQLLSVISGTELKILSNTIFSIDSLTLSPTQDFVVSNNILRKTITTQHAAGNIYISRVYQFQNISNPYTGSVGITYSDGELNALNENNLTLNLHDGNHWMAYPPTTRDVTSNVVLTSGINNINISEMTLADLYKPLGLQIIVLGNPVLNNILTLQVNAPSTLRFYSAIGSLVRKQNVTPGLINISMERYAKGVYFLVADKAVWKILVH